MHVYRMIIYKELIVLMITIMSQHVCSKVIIVNADDGRENTRCCVEGKCPCSSLSMALKMMDSNTIINITSEAFTLNDNIKIGSGSINNVTISSHMATVNCSNIMISCESCDDVVVSGITWVSCIFVLSNCSVLNCTLMYSNFVVSGSISIEQSVSLSLTSPFWINNTEFSGYVNLTISGSILYSLTVSDSSCLAQWNITIINTALINGSSVFFEGFRVCADVLYGIHMANVTVRRSLVGIHLEFNATKGNISASVLSSTFVDNNKVIKCVLTAHSKDASTSILISDSEFINNGRNLNAITETFSSLVNLSTEFIISSTITLNNVNFTNNHVEDVMSMLSVITSPLLPMSFTKVYVINVNFINNDVTIAVYIAMAGPNNQLILHHCKFISNNFLVASLFLLIRNDIVTERTDSNPNLIVRGCSFFRNRFVEGIYITGLTYYYIIEMTNTIFDQNSVNGTIIIVKVPDINITVSISASSFIGNNIIYGCLSIPESSSVYLASSRLNFMNNTGIFVSASQTTVTLKSSNFTYNTGGCIHLVDSHLHLSDNVFFHSNSAEKGAALNINTGTKVHITSRSNIQFVNNSATVGGAVFVDATNLCGSVFTMEDSARVTFKDNIAVISRSW